MGAGQRGRGSSTSAARSAAAHARGLTDPLRASLLAFWCAPGPATARAYLTEALAVLRVQRKRERAEKADSPGPITDSEPVTIAPYTLYELLGHGAEGVVYRAKRTDDDRDVAFKMPADGDAVFADQLANRGIDFPDGLVRTYETGAWNGQRWIARELADETLHTALQREGPWSNDHAQVLEVFTVACRGVAWLHERGLAGSWSAHARNVYRFPERWRPVPQETASNVRAEDVGSQVMRPVWKLGDFGRAWRWSDEAGRFREQNQVDFDAEHVGYGLRLDDSAMLGGLLVQTLTGKRWEWFFRALVREPFCSAVYPLTGDRETDERLSRIVNRCWRGDSGGAPLLANDGRGEQTIYDDPLELLDDVNSALVSRSP